MNFEDWHKTQQELGEENVFIRSDNRVPIAYAHNAWQACKGETLKIIEKHSCRNQMTNFQIQKLSEMEKEIEEL